MPQKILDPIRNLPWRIQNLDIVKKIHDFKSGKHTDAFSYHLSSAYGMLDRPSAVAFDDKLGLLAVGTDNGVIKICGAPGIVFNVQSSGPPVKSLLFLPEEGRLVYASECGSIVMFELDASHGQWSSVSSVRIPQNTEDDRVSCICLGVGVLYVGSLNGTLRQVAIKDGLMTLGDDALTACTSALVKESVPLNKRDEMGVDSPIVSLQLQPEGNHLLIAYAGGCVAVAVPQPIPAEAQTETVNTTASTEATAPTAEGEIVTPNAEEGTAPSPPEEQVNGKEDTKLNVNGEKTENVIKSMPSTPVKEHSEKRSATLKFKTLTRSLRASDSSKAEKSTHPPLLVPPAPRISHLLLRDQPVQYATWRVTATDSLSTEVTVAYGDGAFQIWPIVAAVNQEHLEPIIVSMRDPPNTPYGPLPCGAIKKILMNLGSNGLLTAFSGGLPRPQYENRYTVSVLQDHEHHVCFQFGSEVKDFILLPAECKEKPEPEADESSKPAQPPTPNRATIATTLLVLTQRELVAIDLVQPNWPVYQCSPYLQCLNCVPLTVVKHVGKLPADVVKQLRLSACVQSEEHTNQPWPIWGGRTDGTTTTDDNNDDENNNIVCLGYANGMIGLWSIGRGDASRHLGMVHTAALFDSSDFQGNQKSAHSVMEEGAWPPFRPVGGLNTPMHTSGQLLFDDPRLPITQIDMQLVVDKKSIDDCDKQTATKMVLNLLIGQAGGQFSVWTLPIGQHQQQKQSLLFEPDVHRINANLIGEENSTKYVWNDLPALRPIEGILSNAGLNQSFYPQTLVQLYPPSPITSMHVEFAWNMIAIGSNHGFAVIDLLQSNLIHGELCLQEQSTTVMTASQAGKNVNQHVAAVQQAIVAQGRKLSANMRRSFRRLKSLRTTVSVDKSQTADGPATETPTAPAQVDGAAENATPTTNNESDPNATSSTSPPPAAPADSKETAKTETVVEPKTEPTATTNTEEKVAEQTTEEVQPAQPPPPPEPVQLSLNDSVCAAVKSVLFSDTYIYSANQLNDTSAPSSNNRSPSLWIGTTIGKVFIYAVEWKATAGPVTLTLCKDLQLHHHAPVLSVSILDSVNCEPVTTSPRYRDSHIEAPEPVSSPNKEAEEPAAVEAKSESAETDTTTAPQAGEGDASDTAVDVNAANSNATNTTTTAASEKSQPPESHYVLVCSEEQLKLFNLPTLRAVYKHKFVDRLRVLGLSSVMHDKEVQPTSTTTKTAATAATNNNQATATTDAQVVDENEQAANENDKTEITTSTTTVATTASAAPNRKQITSVGLQEFVTGSVDNVIKSEWNVVVTLLDGQTAILSLPTLRKVFKERSFTGYSPNTTIPHVASQTKAINNNYVFWFNAPQLVVTELCHTPALHSLATYMTVDHKPLDFVKIALPAWVRPIVSTPSAVNDSKANEEADQQAAAAQEPAKATEASEVAATTETTVVNSKHEQMINGESDNKVPQKPITNSVIQNGLTNGDDDPHLSTIRDNNACDITMDSIKEYVNGNDACVTVRTTETSMEKRTLVESGKITTTVHEVEKVDGKLVKNDVVKIVTDGEPEAASVITGNA